MLEVKTEIKHITFVTKLNILLLNNNFAEKSNLLLGGYESFHKVNFLLEF